MQEMEEFRLHRKYNVKNCDKNIEMGKQTRRKNVIGLLMEPKHV